MAGPVGAMGTAVFYLAPPAGLVFPQRRREDVVRVEVQFPTSQLDGRGGNREVVGTFSFEEIIGPACANALFSAVRLQQWRFQKAGEMRVAAPICWGFRRH